MTTAVTGPLQGQGEAEDSAWKSQASDLVIESEIWWTVLFRQHSIYTMLSNVLKDGFGHAPACLPVRAVPCKEHFEVQGRRRPPEELRRDAGDLDDLGDSDPFAE